MFLRKNLSKIITTDEKLFHLSQTGVQTPFYYKKRGDRRRCLATHAQRSFPKSVMVWAGISMNGKTKLRFVTQGVKINSEHYQKNIMKPFIEEDLIRLYPNGDGILQQDSAPSHTSKSTLQFLRSEGINFIPPELWTPNSPDNAPMDFNIWSWMERELKKRKVNTVLGLKRALIDIWDSLPQDHIDKVLNHWPKRCMSIYQNRGNNIEHLFKSRKRPSSQ